MKSTGIVRKIDELGRIVVPIEIRRTLGIAEKDSLEIYVNGNMIILKKYIAERPVIRRKKYVCAVCQKEIDPDTIS
ncbi:MAG: AbrB/MazE/SpoVT family DNA-binding domain-containing protein [Oscillospiraceae bacterium]|jgi:transcriptional pleiotropic regulator of transition state genes|nr:AbrB/MazE/SpoVT family DNA-binding domain-containing protein [Oscillospiraceae bacterium]